jgi:hypothetical protein
MFLVFSHDCVTGIASERASERERVSSGSYSFFGGFSFAYLTFHPTRSCIYIHTHERDDTHHSRTIVYLLSFFGKAENANQSFINTCICICCFGIFTVCLSWPRLVMHWARISESGNVSFTCIWEPGVGGLRSVEQPWLQNCR